MNLLKEQFLDKREIKDYKKSHILTVSKKGILKTFLTFLIVCQQYLIRR